jgi:hypothetical protein
MAIFARNPLPPIRAKSTLLNPSGISQLATATARKRQRGYAGAWVAILLALGFLLISVAPLAGGGFWRQVAVPAIQTAVTQPLWRTRLGFNLAVFAVVLLLLHLCYAALLWVLAVASQKAWPRLRGSRRQWILLWFFSTSAWLLLANAARFPDSALGISLYSKASARVLGTSVYALMTVVVAGVAVAALSAAAARSSARRALLLGTAALGAVALATALAMKVSASSSPPSRQPNIVLLGIDSLRPDFVDAQRTPHIREFLSDSVQLTDAITPLARTFPAWVSILSGRNPHTTGAYMNLLSRERIHTGETLPATLRRQGYHTAYAIDETRFSNIDRSYDFDQAVTPSMGATDFVLASFADTPLSNLIVNTRLGEWLFPHLYANRAAHVVYDPQTFVRRLDRELRFDQPLFLAVHLTLPHWPYSWATSSLEQNKPESGEGAGTRARYVSTLIRVDQQFGALLTILRRHGVLDNALVVVLSDHGEALGTDSDLLTAYLPEKSRESTGFENQGHGSSVLSPPQFRVVLGFRGYGAASALLPGEGRAADVPASLIDIAPTLLDLLSITPREQFDGVSLAPALRKGSSAMPELAQRIRFTETEFSPRNLSPDNLTGSALAEAVTAFQLDPNTDRLSVRIQKLNKIMGNRQYAALLGNRILAAAIPGLRVDDGQHQLVVVPDPFKQGREAETVQASPSTEERERLRRALQSQFNIRFAAPEGIPPG